MTHWKAFTESAVIRFADIGTRSATVKIVRVEAGEIIGAGAKTSKRPMIYIEGKEKPIAGNASICRAIEGMYGPTVEDWAGKLITIYGDPNVMFGGERVGGIRVRPTIPKEPGRARAPVMETTDVPPSEATP